MGSSTSRCTVAPGRNGRGLPATQLDNHRAGWEHRLAQLGAAAG